MLHFFKNKISVRLWQKGNPCLPAWCLEWAAIEECVYQKIFHIYWEETEKTFGKKPKSHLKARLKYLYYRNTTSKNRIWKVNISVLSTTFLLSTATWLFLEHGFLLILTGVRSNPGNLWSCLCCGATSDPSAPCWELGGLASKALSLTVTGENAGEVKIVTQWSCGCVGFAWWHPGHR